MYFLSSKWNCSLLFGLPFEYDVITQLNNVVYKISFQNWKIISTRGSPIRFFKSMPFLFPKFLASECLILDNLFWIKLHSEYARCLLVTVFPQLQRLNVNFHKITQPPDWLISSRLKNNIILEQPIWIGRFHTIVLYQLSTTRIKSYLNFGNEFDCISIDVFIKGG